MGALVDRVQPSLAVVRYTYASEEERRDLEGTCIAIGDGSLFMFASGLTPAQLADAQMVDFRVVLPPGVNGAVEETELPATFLGRDERADLAYIKLKDADKRLPPLKPVVKPIELGQPLYSVGLLPKDSGYMPYVRQTQVSAQLRGASPLVLTASGLTNVGSPVFDAAGDFVAFIADQELQLPIWSERPAQQMAVPPLYVTPVRELQASLSDPPTAPGSRKVPWLGVVQMTGVDKDVAKVYGIEGTPAIQIGDVVASGPAATAGINGGEIITAVDGEPIERGDQPEELPIILSKRLVKKNVGDTVQLTVLRERGKPAEQVSVTLGERPAMAHTAARFYAEELGFTVRELVFNDRYARRLASDAPGVSVVFVKDQGNAAAGGLRVNDVIVKINQTDVKDVAQFESVFQQARKDAPKDAVVLEVLRGVATQIIRIQPTQR